MIGLHYPSDYSDYSVCHSFNKPFWASEESSSYDDLNGAACWARVITSHWVLSGMTVSVPSEEFVVVIIVVLIIPTHSPFVTSLSYRLNFSINFHITGIDHVELGKPD